MTICLGDRLLFPTSKRHARNRFLKAAMSEHMAVWKGPNDLRNGIVTTSLVNLYSKWGHGGWGVILTGNIIVDAMHMESAGNMLIEKTLDSTERREMLQKLATAAKADGALFLAQLGHAGRQTPMGVNALGLTLEQMKTEVIDKFVYAAEFCASAGLDGIELHAAYDYLLSQFMSPTANKRKDKYGGSVENRARIVVEVCEGIRKVVPSDFVIGIKINPVEFQDAGLRPAEAALMAEMFERAGFDFIELSGGTYSKNAVYNENLMSVSHDAFFVEFAKTIMKRLQKTTVYLTGGFRTAAMMLDAVLSHATHGIGIGRPATQEYDLATKWLTVKSSATQKPLVCINDFVTGLAACQSQMEQAGRSFFDGDPNKGVMNLDDKDTVTRYKKALQKFRKACDARTAEGEMPYEPLVFT